MNEETITQRMKDFSKKSFLSEQAIAGIIGIAQSTFSAVVNGKFHRNPDSNLLKMERFLDTIAVQLTEIDALLVKLQVNHKEIPDRVAIKRMMLHRRRSEVINSLQKTRTRQHSTSGASLQVN